MVVMKELPGPRKTFVLEKGLYTQPQGEVTAAVPTKLPPLPEGAPRIAWDSRTGLWPRRILMGAGHGQSLRQQFFGIGQVKTPDDFGLQESGRSIRN